MIACSWEAKAMGVQNVMMVDEAKRIRRDLILVPQKPDLYRRELTSSWRLAATRSGDGSY